MKTFSLLIFAINALTLTHIRGQEVYESTLSKNSIIISLSPDEVAQARKSKDNSRKIAVRAAWKVLELTGIPESVTGKVAGLAVWDVLVLKYTSDIYKLTRNLTERQAISIKYLGVNINAVRAIWTVSEAGDELMPGSEATKQAVDVINTLINAYLQ